MNIVCIIDGLPVKSVTGANIQLQNKHLLNEKEKMSLLKAGDRVHYNLHIHLKMKMGKLKSNSMEKTHQYFVQGKAACCKNHSCTYING